MFKWDKESNLTLDVLPQVKGDRGYCLLDLNDGAFYNRDLLLRLLAGNINVDSALKLSRGEELVSTIPLYGYKFDSSVRLNTNVVRSTKQHLRRLLLHLDWTNVLYCTRYFLLSSSVPKHLAVLQPAVRVAQTDYVASRQNMLANIIEERAPRRSRAKSTMPSVNVCFGDNAGGR